MVSPGPGHCTQKTFRSFYKRFWSTTLFTKIYHPRIDFEKTAHAAREEN